MDTLRGNFGSVAESGGYDPADDDVLAAAVSGCGIPTVR